MTDGINSCVCVDGSMLDRDLDDVQWLSDIYACRRYVISSPEPVDSGPEADESAVPSREDTIKLQHLDL